MSERNIKLERLLFSCPEIDYQDLDTYPLVSDEDRHYMETDFYEDTSCVHLYPYVRKNAAGTPFIDVYVWDQMLYPEMCRRFIICEGYRLRPYKENVSCRRSRSAHRVFPAWMDP